MMGVKVVYDIINCVGNDVMFELFGLVSWIDDDVKFGVVLMGSIQECYFGYVGVIVNDWNIGVWGDLNDLDMLFNNSGDIYQNVLDVGQLYVCFNDLCYVFFDIECMWINVQLILQYVVLDNLVVIFDYLYVENEIQEYCGEIINWV